MTYARNYHPVPAILILGFTSLFLLISSVATPQRLSSSELEKIISDEAAYVFAAAQFTARLSFSDANINISTPAGGIILGRSYFNNLHSKVSAENFIFSARFIVSHELAHQMQFKDPAVTSGSSCEKRRLVECQADVIAGILMSKMYTIESDDIFNEKVPDIITGIEYIYTLGADENMSNSHPTPLQRRNAFRFGLGFILGKSGNSAITEKNPIMKGSDYMRWSFEISKMIMHFPLSNTKNIVCVSSTTDWDPQIAHPNYTFSEQYLNTGDKPLKIKILYQVCGVKALNNHLTPDSIPKHTPLSGDSKLLTAVLDPGKTIDFSGSLSWLGTADHSHMPRAILSTDADALYSVEQNSGSGDSEDGINTCTADFSDREIISPAVPEETIFLKDLKQIASDLATNDWPDLEGGFGLKLGSLVTYRSTIDPPFTIKNTIFVPTDEKTKRYFPLGFVDLTFYQGNDSKAAMSKFKDLSSLLKKCYQGLIDWESSSSTNDGVTSYTMEGTEKTTNVRMELESSNPYDSWRVKLIMKNPVTRAPRKPQPAPPKGPFFPSGQDFFAMIISAQGDGFNSIKGDVISENKIYVKCKPSFPLPEYVRPTSSLLFNIKTGSSTATFAMFHTLDKQEELKRLDSIRQVITADLQKLRMKFTIKEIPENADGKELDIYLDANPSNDHPDFTIKVYYPDKDDEEKIYAIGFTAKKYPK